MILLRARYKYNNVKDKICTVRTHRGRINEITDPWQHVEKWRYNSTNT